MAREMQVIRPSNDWIWLQSEEPWQPPPALLDIPGVTFVEPWPAKPCWRLRIPQTAWTLPEVVAFLRQFDVPGPPPGVVGREVPLPWHPVLARLHRHQREAVQFIVNNGSALVGDQMGLGKTITALAAASALRALRNTDAPTLIVAPKSVRNVWRRELEAFELPDADKYIAIEGVTPDIARLAKARWIFSHPDVLHAWWSQIYSMRPVVAILDEAHLFRNGRTRRGKAAALALSSVPHRIALSGTPLPNRVGDWWNVLQLVTGPWTWGAPKDFRIRYAGAYHDGHGLRDSEPTKVDELHARLRSVYIRRTVEEVGLDLPALTRQNIEVEGDLAAYHALFEGRDPAQVVRAILERRASTKTIAWLGKLRKLTSKMKLDATRNEVTSALEAGESIVVFTWERETANKIAGCFADGFQGRWGVEGTGSFCVTGAIPQHGRDAIVDAFQASGRPSVLAATFGALSVGVTLTKARIVLMHDLDFVPSEMLQAEARVRRIGQTRPVLSKWMVARGTLDEMIAKIIRQKAAVLEVAGDVDGSALADTLDPGWLSREVSALMRWVKEG